MAVRRSLGNCAASTLGRILAVDASTRTVTMWEIKTHAALLAASREDHATGQQLLTEGHGNPMCVTHFIKTDATNKAVWHKRKLHVGKVASLYLAMTHSPENPEVLQYVDSTCDLQIVPNACPANTLYSMVTRHVQSVGAHVWNDPSVTDADGNVFHMYVSTSDAGCDESKAREYMRNAMYRQSHCFFWEADCLGHVTHLVSKKLLITAQEIVMKLIPCEVSGYFSSVAMLSNVWREHSIQIQKAFKELFGEDRAQHCAKCLPPRCLSGRWGSVSAVEAFLLKAERDELEAVFQKALRAPRRRPVRKQPVDDLDAIAEYTERIGKWRTGALASLACPNFFTVMGVIHGVRGPLDHFLAFVRTHDYREEHSLGCLAELVCGRASSFSQEYDLMLNPECTLWQPVFDRSRLSIQAVLGEAIIMCVLQQAADFDRRVVACLARPPLVLLKLVATPPGVVDEQRKQLAIDIATWVQEKSVHENVKKLDDLFRPELEQARVTGTLPNDSRIYFLLRPLAERWSCDIEDVEGINSMISVQAKRSPHLAIPLLSSRIGISKTCGVGGGGTRATWSEIKDHVETVVERAVQHIDDVEQVMTPERWHEAEPCDEVTTAHVKDYARRRGQLAEVTADTALASYYNLSWYRGLWKTDSKAGSPLVHAIRFDRDDEAWLCPLTHFTQGWWVQCKCNMDSVTVCTPLSFKASTTVFAEKSRRINTPEAEVEVFKLTLVWAWSPVTGLRSASVRKEGLLFKMQLLPRATEHETAVASGAKADTDARPAVDLDVVQDLLAEPDGARKAAEYLKTLVDAQCAEDEDAELEFDEDGVEDGLGDGDDLVRDLRRLEKRLGDKFITLEAESGKPVVDLEEQIEIALNMESHPSGSSSGTQPVLGPKPASPSSASTGHDSLWLPAALSSWSALHERGRLLKDVPLQERGNLSLVQHEVAGDITVSLVEWQNANEHYGRVVRMKPGNVVVYTFGSSSPWKYFDGCTIVLPSVGCGNMKIAARSKFKNILGQTPARLKQMWTRALTRLPAPACTTCSLCGHDGTSDVVRTCAVCLLDVHDGCSQASLTQAERNGGMKQLQSITANFTLPDVFKGALLCYACAAVQQ